MKDVALARTIEDSTFSALNTLVYQNQHEIIQTLGKNEALLHEIITLTHQGNKDAHAFLNELFLMAKSFSKEVQVTLFNALAKQGLFDDPVVADDLNVLTAILEHSPVPIRKLILSEKMPSASLLQRLIERLKDESEDSGCKGQIIEVFRLLLDTTGVGSAISSSLSVESNDLDKFLTLFYEEHAESLFNILSLESTYSLNHDNLTTMVLDLLSFFITQNGMFCKNYLLSSSLLRKISSFILESSGRKTFVRLSALRVFRICLGIK
jgi:protein phosphatase-4 regulatory subunit 3